MVYSCFRTGIDSSGGRKVSGVFVRGWFILLTLCLLTSFKAQAVLLSADQGQVLIFPYFSTEKQNITEFDIVNTRTQAKALKILFLAKDNGAKVFDVNAYVAPKGVAALKLNFDSKTNATTLQAENNVCLQGSSSTLSFSSREGFIEVIEMGEVSNNKIPSSKDKSEIAFSEAITKDCPAIQNGWKKDGIFQKKSNTLTAPKGGLFGDSRITLPAQVPISFSLEPTMLDGFMDKSLFTAPGSDHPNLSDVSPKISYVMTSRGVKVSHWTQAGHMEADPVSAVLMSRAVVGLFQNDPLIASQTNSVFTFPTKTFYPNFSNSTKCFQGIVQVLNDIFAKYASSSNQKMCANVNVLEINQSPLLESPSPLRVQTQMRNGMLKTDVSLNNLVLVSDEKDTYEGAPVIGFSVNEMFENNKTEVYAQKARVVR